ncbi:PE family protein [Mycobacterium intermedium]|uniref:PE family protein n=1 Tax=Mycobacterium intermedium TaxID=28445 RepID=A0A1E3SDF1_MYCIE|nr:PE family protein [Mycobacterium intermedium]ODR00102.1 hypothetical protein BHQ20_14380 [Mycobacterium intermedium]OPE45863.1 PE family protein [Mycobacterium intermedium]ORA99903.1 PE family protein [Mycobacterium intermedium]
MSFVVTSPQLLQAAATDLAGINSTISEANRAAATAIRGLLPAGADEVSAAVAALFDAHAATYQSLSAQATKFHDLFVQTLTVGAGKYAAAEANTVQLLANQVGAAAQATPAEFIQELDQAQIAFNTNLVNSELAFNKSLVLNEVAWERAIFGTDSALNGVINRGFNAGNLLFGTGQQLINTVVGAQVPTNFTSSLLLGSSAQVFNGGQIGSLVGAFDQSLAGAVNVAGLVVGSPPGLALLSLAPPPVQSALATPGVFLQQLEQSQIAFNTNLVNSELAFDKSLVLNEVAWERATFGTDSALNGVINRGFNAGNLLLGTGQQLINTVAGAQVPVDFNSSLLIGSGAQPFNGGEIGGLLGAFDQTTMAGINFLGLITGR